MNTGDRLTLRARQILDDPTLPANQRLKNSAALLAQLAASVRERPEMRESLLSEIADVSVRDQMRAALAD